MQSKTITSLNLKNLGNNQNYITNITDKNHILRTNHRFKNYDKEIVIVNFRKEKDKIAHYRLFIDGCIVFTFLYVYLLVLLEDSAVFGYIFGAFIFFYIIEILMNKKYEKLTKKYEKYIMFSTYKKDEIIIY